MERQTLKVEGMSCDHCVKTIRKAVGELSGVQEVLVDLDKKEVSVEFDEATIGLEKISAKITDAGYQVVGS